MKCFCSNPELSDRDLGQNSDGKDRKKKQYSQFSLFEDPVFANTRSLKFICNHHSILAMFSWSFIDGCRVEKN